MFKSIRWYIYFVGYLFYTTIHLQKIDKLEKKGEWQARNEYVQRIVHKWAGDLLKKLGVSVSVSGKENIPQTGPVVFVANHQGNFDILVLLAIIEKSVGFVAKEELEKLFIVSNWMKKMGCVFISRGNPRKGLKAISEAVKLVKNGQSMVIFPEGTRSQGGAVKSFKPGSLKLATRAQVPIVPIVIEGTYKIMEAQSGLRLKPTTVSLKILPAVATADLNKEEVQALPENIRDMIIKNMSNEEVL